MWQGWSKSASRGKYVRPDGSSVTVLVLRTPEGNISADQLRTISRTRARIEHPHILRMLFMSSHDTGHIRVYAFVEGVSVEAIVRSLHQRGRGLPVRSALEITQAVAAAAAHVLSEKPVGDDDLTYLPIPIPEQILIDPSGRVKLAALQPKWEQTTACDLPPGYAPPQSTTPEEDVVYALGALIVTLLNNEAPAAASVDPKQHEDIIRRAMIRTLGRAGDDTPEAVITIIRSCLARQPEARPSLEALQASISNIIQSSASPALHVWAEVSINTLLRRFGDSQPPLPVNVGGATEPPTEDDEFLEDAETVEENAEHTARLPEGFQHPPVRLTPTLVIPEPVPVDLPPPAPEIPPAPPATPVVDPGAIAVNLGSELTPSVPEWQPDRRPIFVLIGTACLLSAAALLYVLWSNSLAVPQDIGEAWSDEDVVETTSAHSEEDEAAAPPPSEASAEPIAQPEQPLPPEPVVASPTPPAVPVETNTATVTPPEPPQAETRPVESAAVDTAAPAARIRPDDGRDTAAPEGMDAVAVDEPTTTDAPPVEAVEDVVPAAPPDGPFQVEFVSMDPRVYRMEVQCHQGRGSGVDRVVITNAGVGPCRVTGHVDGERLVVNVSLSHPQTWQCFSDGSRSCR